VDVGGVALGGEAIVANVNPGTLNIEVLDVQGVKEVSVLGKSSGVGGASSADDVLEGNVLGCEISVHDHQDLVRFPYK
jgi:hypothetical protein